MGDLVLKSLAITALEVVAVFVVWTAFYFAVLEQLL